MRILLVYPNICASERYGGLAGLFGGRQIPLGLYYLAAYLRRHSNAVEALDAECLRLTDDEVVRRVKQGRFTLVGISATTVAFHRAAALAWAVKAAVPGAVTVVGGPHVSSQPEHPLAACAAFDYAIRNEGEETLRELVEHLQTGADPCGVMGLVYRRDGRVTVNPPRPYISDINSLPFPAYDLIPDLRRYSPPPFNSRFSPVVNMITSRGCPNQCTFCENTTFGRYVRMRSAVNVVEEMELLIRKHGVREISFVDDTFTIRPARIREIFDLVRQRGLRFPWSCMSRVNTVDEPLLKFMRDNGCWYIAFGIESGDEEVLKVIRKNIRLADVERVVGACRRLGITTKGFFMIGHPTETAETIKRTISLACRLPLDHVVVTINTPMPGTEQYRRAHEYGELDESSWQRFNYWDPVFVPRGLTREVLRAWHREFLRRFYLRPRTLRTHLRAGLGGPSGWRQLARIVGALPGTLCRAKR